MKRNFKKKNYRGCRKEIRVAEIDLEKQNLPYKGKSQTSYLKQTVKTTKVIGKIVDKN